MRKGKESVKEIDPARTTKDNKLRFRKKQFVSYLERVAKRPRALIADVVVAQVERCEGLVDLKNGQRKGRRLKASYRGVTSGLDGEYRLKPGWEFG